ncbi:hypothetical protein OG225_30650 [Nocardia sp. NBC_01377]|uniref:hypothetical protein n=1 Tax=Nocardia sp. NBC_01377 TaxID=2903595 RepID=UPI0032567232
MTLILSAVTRGFVFHASDRLFTIQRKKGHVEEWDPRANKTIVVVGSDCWLVLGYTGLAYLDGKPTDQFLAEAISGVSDLDGGMVMGTRNLGLHYAEIIRRIVEAVSAQYDKLSCAVRKYPLIVAGTGIQMTRPRRRELIFRLGFSEDGYDGGDGHTERYPSLWRYGCIPAGDVNNEVHEQMRKRLRSDETHDSPDSFRKIMVDGVRATAALSEFVGEDVISVILDPEEREISVHFDPIDPSRPITPGKGAPHEGELKHKLEVYTPYAILPNIIYCPSVASVGGWRGFDGIRYRFIGPEPVVGGGFYGTYARKPQPR